MKKGLLKKSLIGACCGVMALSGLMFAGCTKEEIKENTQVATQSVIETATDILPFEYSPDMAVAILSNACATSLAETNMKSEFSSKMYSFGGMDIATMNSSATSIYINNDGIVSEYCETSGYEDEFYTVTIKEDNGQYKQYAVFGSKYKEIENSSSSISTTSIPSYYGRLFLTGNVEKSMDGGSIETMSMLSNVIGGRYYNGKTYINASINYDDLWGEPTDPTSYFVKYNYSIEYIIENDKITNVTLLKNMKHIQVGEDTTINTSDDVMKSEENQIASVDFTYGGQVIEDAPTSLEGLTEATSDSNTYYLHYGFNNQEDEQPI